MKLTFTVLGHPEPAGSKRAFPFKRKDGRLAVAVSDANPNAKAWKTAVAGEALLALDKAGRNFESPLLEGALEVTMRFYRMRPKNHFRTGKHSGELKADAPAYPTTKPDSGKLCRGTTDAMTGVVFRDDAQIVREVVEKHYGSPERVEVEIEELDGECIIPVDPQLLSAADKAVERAETMFP